MRDGQAESDVINMHDYCPIKSYTVPFWDSSNTLASVYKDYWNGNKKMETGFSIVLYAEKSAQDTQIACANTKCTQKRGKTEHIGLYKYLI